MGSSSIFIIERHPMNQRTHVARWSRGHGKDRIEEAIEQAKGAVKETLAKAVGYAKP
jgi:hypothetical protein